MVLYCPSNNNINRDMYLSNNTSVSWLLVKERYVNMIIKTSLSKTFPDVSITGKLIWSLKNKPVTYRGQEVGRICDIMLEDDIVLMEIDDLYIDEIMRCTSFAMEVGP